MDREFLKFRRIEAWAMRELGFNYYDIGVELGCTAKAAEQLRWKAIKKKEVPPSEDYCDEAAPIYLQRLIELTAR